MKESQLFIKPNVPDKGSSLIYPKSDGFWYYMNYDGIERQLPGTINWGSIEGDILKQVDLINLLDNISEDKDGGLSNSVYTTQTINLGSSYFNGGQSLDGGLSF